MNKPASSWSVFWRLLCLFRPYWGWMVLGILLALITALANVSLLALSGWFISIMAIAGVAGITEINYFTPSAAIRGLAIVRTAGRYIERVVSHEATFRLLAVLRQWFYNKLEPLAPAVLQQYRHGDILNRISADINTLENFYIRIISPLVVAILAIVLYGLFLSHYHVSLGWAELGLLFLAGFIVPIVINRLSKKSGERLNQTTSDLRNTAIDSVQGMGELLIYGAAKKQLDKMQVLSNRLTNDQLTQARLAGFSQGFIGLCANITLWIILIISVPLITAGTLQPAHLAMLTLFAVASYEVILPLPLALQLLPITLDAGRRLFHIVDSKPLINEPKHPSPTPPNFDIEFKQVNFSYTKDSNHHLKNLSFIVKEGEKLAIVGPSGSGKTSLVNLLARFWELKQSDSGIITLGGYPLANYKSDTLRRYFSILSQHPFLFNNTIRNNLLLAKPEASDALLTEVCRVAQIDDFIRSQPHGYETWVGEAGLKLSGGQAKRIAIARTLLKDSPILILDEPGEGLDAETEKALLNAIFDYRPDASILLITHKNAGLDRVDKIIRL